MCRLWNKENSILAMYCDYNIPTFIFFVFIKSNVLSYIKFMLTGLYKYDKLLFYLLIIIIALILFLAF